MGSLAFTVDVEDWYQGIPFSAGDDPERRLDGSCGLLLDLLAEFDVRGTFFLLGPVVEKHRALVRRIVDDGHEIGSHGWSHDLLYEMSPERFREETRRSLDVIADATGVAATVYRAAYFSIVKQNLWALDILAELGIKYDSSIFPVHNWRYGIPDFGEQPRWVETKSGRIGEVPMSVNRLFGQNVPVSGGAYFRLYPYWFTRSSIRARVADGRPTNFYIHPWELDPEHPRVPFHWKARMTHYANLGTTVPKLRRLLGDFEFTTLGRVAEQCLE